MVNARVSFCFVALVVVAVLSCHGVESAVPLQVGYYSNSCPDAETIVLQTLQTLIDADPEEGPGIPATLLRLHFHDCFVRGCDASVLLDVPKSEKTAPPNARLLGFEAVDAIKSALEEKCPGVVSCADILAFAARDSVSITLGPNYAVPAGRRDGNVSMADDASKFLPDAQSNVTQLVANFANQGLSKEEMVILSGAHTIGDAACHHVDSRIYNYPSKDGVDPNIPADYAKKLKKKCRDRGLKTRTFDLDFTTDLQFDTEYYNNLAVKKGMLVSDQALYTDASTRVMVEKYRKTAAFFDAFAKAMVKMGNIRVLTDTDGQIRTNCRAVNK
ncbi:hypothetical protein KC19_2G195000 [Ceratodon purpureus]|uniref:Peroxidase n=1 Tax=Ceratodon purpureus TaxID=3225 RepID=A0A8T0IVU4_CERPU|nr:hypothetical protein KC19_2G195000 [Ceratodon purpureus]